MSGGLTPPSALEDSHSSLLTCLCDQRDCATEHIKDHVSLIEKSMASYPGGRFPPSLIHHVIIIITGLNKLYDCMFLP